MAAGRICAILLAAASAMVVAQQTPQNDLILAATDATGAFVSDARIEFDSAVSPSWVVARAITDGEGKARFNLPTGGYILFVNACGFDPWIRQISLKEGIIQSITAKLKIATVTESVCVAPPPALLEVEIEPLLLLPLESMALAPVPARNKR
jgi:hypothetical protein